MAVQEIQFDTASGIDMTGWWSNPSTGESYQVVDQFFQDNVLYVKTMQGQIINFNRIQNFVRSDQPITSKETVNHQNTKLLDGLTQNEQPQEGILDDDLALIQGARRTIPVQQNQPTDTKSVNNVILDKMFSKAPEPKIEAKVTWQWARLGVTLDTLVETMDVPKEEICRYVVTKYFSDIVEKVSKSVEEELFGEHVPVPETEQ